LIQKRNLENVIALWIRGGTFGGCGEGVHKTLPASNSRSTYPTDYANPIARFKNCENFFQFFQILRETYLQCL
jgi:hypothetical protein